MRQYRVLIVDDNLINRKMVMAFLVGYGFELSEAESGARAIELVRETRFDLIFMDYRMPGMDGVEAVDIIRRECGENGRAPVIVALTADSGEGDRENFLRHGFQDLAVKPLDRKPLHDILARWLEDVTEDGASGQSTAGKDGGGESGLGGDEKRAGEDSGRDTAQVDTVHMDGARFDSAALHREVRSALESAEHFRSKECRQKVEELLGRPLGEDIRRRLEAVREKLAQFEDDEAEELLRSLAEKL